MKSGLVAMPGLFRAPPVQHHELAALEHSAMKMKDRMTTTADRQSQPQLMGTKA